MSSADNCLILGRGRGFNDLNLKINPNFELCKFISIYEQEKPDFLGRFEDFRSSTKFQNIYMDFAVKEFMIWTGAGSKLEETDNKAFRDSLLYNLAPLGKLHIPLSAHTTMDLKALREVGLALKKLEGKGKEFKMKIVTAPYPLFHTPPKYVGNRYYTLTKMTAKTAMLTKNKAIGTWEVNLYP